MKNNTWLISNIVLIAIVAIVAVVILAYFDTTSSNDVISHIITLVTLVVTNLFTFRIASNAHAQAKRNGDKLDNIMKNQNE